MTYEQNSTDTTMLRNTETALETIRRGFQPVPLVTGDKKSRTPGWTKLRWENTDEGLAHAREKFDAWAEDGHGGIGVLLGAPSGGLVDIDLDHPKTARLKDHFLPPTPARSGRDSRPSTHYWYLVKPGTLQVSGTFKMPPALVDADKQMIVEYRSTGGQTAIPGNVHPTGERYHWAGEAWGGEAGPAVVDGRALLVQTALLGLCTLLVSYWPGAGGRHETYLALAGGLLRVGDGVHPYWQRNIAVVIDAIADATNDEDGGETRYHEAVETTLKRLREGKPAAGFGKLGEILGEEVVRQARVILAQVESAAGLPSRDSGTLSVEKIAAVVEGREERVHSAEPLTPATHDERRERSDLPPAPEDETRLSAERDPLEERAGSWEALDLDPYLTGQVRSIEPTVMEREDGQALLYPGRLNMLYGPSEAAKSWLSLYTCIQLIERGERVVYLDLEDEPVNTLERLRYMGASPDDLRTGFRYVRPEEPLASMQRTRWGEAKTTEAGVRNEAIFQSLLEENDPAMIVADGMTVLYGLHGLDSNDSVQTDIITSWLKKLTRNGRTTVLVVDHTAKNPTRGSMPIGSQHKVSMVQGTLLQTYPVRQPMPGAVGEVELIVLKDRPGKVRAISQKSGEKAQLAAKVIMDSTSEGRTEIRLEVPAGSNAATDPNSPQSIDLRNQREADRLAKMEQENDRILALYRGEVGRALSKKQIIDGLFGTDDATQLTRPEKTMVQGAMRRLIKDGTLSRIGSTRDTAYALTVAFDD